MSSKYDKVFEARGVTASAEKAAAKKGSATKRTARKGAASADDDSPRSDGGGGVGQKRRGRPNGKRSNPSYVGFTTYIPEVVRDEVKIALIEERKVKKSKRARELSELVEELLTGWLKGRRPGF